MTQEPAPPRKVYTGEELTSMLDQLLMQSEKIRSLVEDLDWYILDLQGIRLDFNSSLNVLQHILESEPTSHA